MSNSSWKLPGDGNWPSASAAWQKLDELRAEFKRNASMRMGRGDVRSAVLRLLLESPMHGYQIIHEIESRSAGAWKPSPGSVYPTLQLLADEGLIASSEAEGRRTFTLTDAGRAAATVANEGPAPWAGHGERAHSPRGSLAMAGVELARAAAEVARTGSAEQIAEAERLLDETKRAIFGLLSQD